MSLDDIRRLNMNASKIVAEAYRKSVEHVLMPEIERRELREYMTLTPEQHGELMQRVGKQPYQEYADAMEKAKVKYGMGE